MTPLTIEPRFPTREAWLVALGEALAAQFEWTLPKLRVSVGFTSSGLRSNRIGECWAAQADSENHCQIFVHPRLIDPMTVAGVVAHELIHAIIGVKAQHGPEFRKVAVGIGLSGKMTATVPGPEFILAVEPILFNLGPFPHGSLSGGAEESSKPKKQTTRMIKLSHIGTDDDPGCGFIGRTSQKWIDVADEQGSTLCCPICGSDNDLEVG